MPGILQGQTVTEQNPALCYFYQEEGLLQNVDALSYAVYTTTGTTPVVSGTVNLDLYSDGGNSLGTGAYFAPVDTSSLDVGTYTIKWECTKDTVVNTTYYNFEVFAAESFRLFGNLETYANSDSDLFEDHETATVQKALIRTANYIETITGRVFFPQYKTFQYSVRHNSKILHLYMPLVGLNKIEVIYEGVIIDSLDTYEIDTSLIKVYNRHLNNLLSPDDRYNPKIEFVNLGAVGSALYFSRFPVGVLNVKITGAWGFTDPDWSYTAGKTPEDLKHVIEILTYRKLEDPTKSDPLTSSPGKVRTARTRDQSISFFQNASSSSYSVTGDTQLDLMLDRFMRPSYVGLAG